MKELLSVFTRRAFSAQPPNPALWRPWRGPFERWPHTADLLIALLAFLLNILMWSHNGGAEVMTLATLPDVGAYLCAFAANFALLWRRSHPWQVHGVILAVSVVLYVAAPVHGVVGLAFSLYSLGRFEANNRASLVGAIGALVFVIVDLTVFNSPSTGNTVAAIMVLALWYVGRRLRFRGEYLRLLEERARHLERERNVGAERAVMAERSRIAREMHDIVAHQVSLMTVQAGAARTIAASDPAAAINAMASVEEAGRQALSEMRHLLSVMRPVNAEDALEPQPSLDDLPNLVRQVGEAGLAVKLNILGDLSALPARLELTTYRIVQEALTNVIKHARANSKVSVTVEGRGENIVVTVADNGKGAKPVNTGGHGIVGMRERVQLLGGSFNAGDSDDIGGGFKVRAVLPRTLQET
ncbi:sensor histidine kinase [Teredinibacter purpureus]|uniref:sensor histidine kinase n=1 Tax=Teredinibacter purpureus TaxID=2731756 RepID=UPI0005F7F259|nr:sensor histidine kinase [Teredinibacter purpureus]